ncbi:hypothetical protein V6N12_003344 [Hibiscus sabdariffa]|uniref:Uncharacterized protein n=1 Tax=Hibiscus sabdariffa TaxID=183260 RepID=A0ABR2EBM0_9ROSI
MDRTSQSAFVNSKYKQGSEKGKNEEDNVSITSWDSLREPTSASEGSWLEGRNLGEEDLMGRGLKTTTLHGVLVETNKCVEKEGALNGAPVQDFGYLEIGEKWAEDTELQKLS